MGLRKQLLGSDHPSRATCIVLGVSLGFLALMLYGIFVDFEPVAWLARGAWYCTGAVGVAIAGWLVFAVMSGRRKPHNMRKTTFVLLSPVMAALIAACMWLVVVRGIAGAATGLTGTPTTLPPVVMHTEDRYHRRECDRRLVGASMDGFAQDHLCVSAAYFAAHPNQRVEVQLEGKQGPLGFYITGFRHLRDLGPYVQH